jgi:hypothetical protein
VAASLASARNSPCPFVADKPDKLYLFLNQMSPDRVNQVHSLSSFLLISLPISLFFAFCLGVFTFHPKQLATAFMLDAALVPHLFSHFLLHSTAYSSVSLEW